MQQDPISLRSLKTIATVSQTGSLTRASNVLGLAQSAISKQVRDLEVRMGGAIFYRNGHGMTLTTLGQELIPEFTDLLNRAKSLDSLATDRSTQLIGEVILGIVPSVAPKLASALYAELSQNYPSIKLKVIESYSGDIETALSEGRLDLAVVNRYRANPPNTFRRLFDSPLCLVGRPETIVPYLPIGTNHKKDHISFKTLTPYNFVLPVKPNAIRNLIDEISSRQKVTLNIALQASSSSIIKRLMLDHGCTSILPRHAIAEEIASQQLIAVPLIERIFHQYLVLATSTQHPFTKRSKLVANLIVKATDFSGFMNTSHSS